jgi:hypothetical protein
MSHQKKVTAEIVNENCAKTCPESLNISSLSPESRIISSLEQARCIPNGHEGADDGADSIKKPDLDVSVSKSQISYK